MSVRCFFQTTKKVILNKDLQKAFKRNYLSANYLCQDQWALRLQDPLIKDLKPDIFYYELVQKFKKESKMSAIDADLYVNCLQKDDASKFLGDLEEILRLLRRSPETVNTLPSTTHAAVRALHDVGHVDTLLRFIGDYFNYGVFLDHFLANLLMDKFLTAKNHLAAARVATHMMIQEEFDEPTTRSLMALSSIRYILAEEKDTWVDYMATPEPEQVVKVRVDYVRNPYFDDHFDLKDPNHLVGKTLAWLSAHFEGSVKANCSVLGWSLYEKWDKVEQELKFATEKSLFPEVVSKALEMLEKCTDAEQKSRIEDTLNRCKSESSTSLDSLLEAQVQQDVKNNEQTDIQRQSELYASWLTMRQDRFQLEINMYKKAKLEAEIEAKRKDLEGREEVIFFFDHRGELEVQAREKQKEKERYGQHSINQSQIEEEYIVPEVFKRT